MPSLHANFMKLLLKLQLYNWSQGSIAEQRARIEKTTRRTQISKGVTTEPFEIDGLKAEWIRHTDPQDCVILYFHGGAYALGSINAHREFLSRLAYTTQAQVLAIDYRLAPESPFPAALQDALFAYHWLLQEGWASSQVVLGGDSAGGGLALASVAALKAAEDPLPAGSFCFSPWVDLTFSCKSIVTRAIDDPVLSKQILLPYASAYAGDYRRDYPLISPLFADLSGFCPVLIHVGTDEIFHGEADEFISKAINAGVDARIIVWKGMFHVFQMVPFLPESKESLAEIASFLKKVC